MEPSDTVLLVEDDRLDQKSVARAFRELQITNPLSIVGNGEEALAYLKEKANESPPVLILLDLNMPRMNGIDFLRVIKDDAKYKTIPIVILTTSQEERDRVNSYQLGVAGYMLKPVDFHKFIEIIRTIHIYWRMSLMPSHGGKGERA